MFHALLVKAHNEHVARGNRDNFRPMSFSQFSVLSHKIMDENRAALNK